jgi:tetratricopeptide (TPR) repeat protein
LSRFWILIPLIITVLMHGIGLILLPSALYLYFADTPLFTRLSKLQQTKKVTVIALTAIFMITVFLILYYSSYVFRFRFVPILENRFSLEGYTLFSIKHISDMFNLLIILIPGIIVLLSVIISLPKKSLFKSFENRFLLCLTASSCLAVFMLDPKLGMPRDWDLFSIAGLPAAVFLYINVLNTGTRYRFISAAVLFSSILGLYCLVPRAMILTDHDKSIVQLNRYFVLDRLKNRPVRLALVEYYKDLGNDHQADIEEAKWQTEFPEERIIIQARKVYNTGNFERSLQYYRQIIKMDPLYWNAWSDIGTCMSRLDRPEEALEYFAIADAMNPGNAEIKANIGWAYFYMDDLETALKYWNLSRRMLPSGRTSLDGITAYHKKKRNLDLYLRYLREMVSRDDATPRRLKEMAEFHISMKNFDSAAAYYIRGVSAGLDTMLVKKMIEGYPKLREELIKQTN